MQAALDVVVVEHLEVVVVLVLPEVAVDSVTAEDVAVQEEVVVDSLDLVVSAGAAAEVRHVEEAGATRGQDIDSRDIGKAFGVSLERSYGAHADTVCSVLRGLAASSLRATIKADRAWQWFTACHYLATNLVQSCIFGPGAHIRDKFG